MEKRYNFAVVGGDLRQIALAEMLIKDGHTVYVCAMGDHSPAGADTIEIASFKTSELDYVILPLPLCSESGNINCPFANSPLALKDLLGCINPTTQVLAGLVKPDAKTLADSLGIEITDYYEREELTVANAIPTAEGAIQILLEELPITINRSKCLVIGYGRIGKMLASLLKSFGANVTVAVRKYSDMVWLDANGLNGVFSSELDQRLPEYDFLVNTVPAMVIDERSLKLLKPECLCIDLASRPGGIDFKAAGSLGIKCIWALSLPGKVAPISSGRAIKSTILNIIKERG